MYDLRQHSSKDKAKAFVGRKFQIKEFHIVC